MKQIFNKDASIEANIFAVIALIWLLPVIVAYFFVVYCVVKPITKLVGRIKK
tara:strand:+ start:2795 stop:2950 length:156 start_codon:yes stop_codon:yes gene_type:complete